MITGLAPDTRQYIYRMLFILGIFAAGFMAWDDQYQKAILKTENVSVSSLSATSTHSRYGSMTNGELRQIADITSKGIEEQREEMNRFVNFSNQANGTKPNHGRFIEDYTVSQMTAYKAKYQGKAIALMLELREREPDYLEDMDPNDVEELNRAYYEPFAPFDMDKVAADLTAMAQRLPAT